MIKRLTDEPATLAGTRADLAFPDGLQAVLDTALTRSPADRYQTVAKFADDVKAITGATRAQRAAVPATREYADGATQLLDTTATKQVAAKRAAGAGRTTPLAATRKRSLVPVVIGAVVLLGGAGAGVMLLGGNGGPNGSPATASDSAGRDTTRNTTTATNPAGGRTAGGRTGTGDTTPANPNPQPAGTPRVNVALAHDALNALFDQLDGKTLSPRVVRDSALAFYDAPGITSTDKAFAAWVIGNAYAELQDKPAGCRWAKTAAGLQQQELYTSLVQGLCQ
jgi:hypothetical protein